MALGFLLGASSRERKLQLETFFYLFGKLCLVLLETSLSERFFFTDRIFLLDFHRRSDLLGLVVELGVISPTCERLLHEAPSKDLSWAESPFCRE